MSNSELTQVLARSEELDRALHAALTDSYQLWENSSRYKAALAAAIISLEHAAAFRLLVSHGMYATGIGVLRFQFEALCRAMWLLYAATDEEILKATAELSADAAKEANGLPAAAKMIDALQSSAPEAAVDSLTGLKNSMLKELHQFAHTGYLPLRFAMDGYGGPLLFQVSKSSNGVRTMSGMMLATLAGSVEAAQRLAQLRTSFADCLPERSS